MADVKNRAEFSQALLGLQPTATLETRFVQTLVSGALGTGLTESGRLWIERPGRMRWDYERPERKVAIVLGERTVLYLEEERQWIRGRLGEESGLLPALLAGKKPLSALFTASEAGSASKRRLRPREANAGALEEIVLQVRPDTGEIEGAEVLDSAGNRTRAAQTLGLSPSTLRDKLKKYNINGAEQ